MEEKNMRIVGENHRVVQIGQRIGRLTAIGAPFFIRHKQFVVCLCDCGEFKVADAYDAKYGKVKSCGCLQRDNWRQSGGNQYKHGGKKTRLYRIWNGMNVRCRAPSNKDYKNYGGRGVLVCDEWKASFEAFRDWAIASGYQDGLQIDRYPNTNGNYEPSNCRWATPIQQSNNKRNNKFLEAFGETKTLAQWLRDGRCLVKRGTLSDRLNQGWTTEEAITGPKTRR